MTPPPATLQTACPDCGHLLPAGAAPGFCPRCVLLGAMEEDAGEAVPLQRAGDYELLEFKGRGGMGTVYLAQHVVTGEQRAVKMISAGELASPAARRRFLHEAESAAALRHPGIVAIHETGAQDGLLYYVMDYVPGRTLAAAVQEKPMPPHAAAACMAAVAEAVAHAHGHGVIHRDLKPSNILLDAMDMPRVTDFGLARRMDADSSLTGSQQIMGSPAWMAPEQASGGTRHAGPAVDIYSLGAVLYFLLTARPPFTGDTPQALMRRAAEDEPLPPRRLEAGVPRELENITLRCLEKNPARRYPSAAALAADLRRFLCGEPVQAKAISRAERALRWMRRNPVAASLAGLLLIAAAGWSGYMWRSNRLLEQSDFEKSAALSENKATLAESLLWQAEFQRLSGRQGQRDGTLEAVQRALTLPLSPEQKLRARNAAAAALALPDARFVPAPELPVPAAPELASVSRSGTRYACVMPDGALRFVNLETNTVSAECKMSGHRVDALLEWSYDGTMLACRVDGTRLAMVQTALGILLWTEPVWERAEDAFPGQINFRPAQDGGRLRPWCVIYPDRDGNIVTRDCLLGIVRRIPPPPGPAPQWRALAWSTQQDLLAAACGSRPEIVIYRMSGEPRVEHTLPCQEPVVSLQWENRENWLLAGEASGRLIPWDVRSTTPQPPLEGHTRPVHSAASGAVNNWRFATAAADGTLRLWDRSAGRLLLTLPGTASALRLHAAESRIGPVLHAGQAGWYELQWPEVCLMTTPPNPSEGERSVTRNTDGGLFASLTGEGAVVWRKTRGNSNNLLIPARKAAAVRFLPDSSRLALAGPEGVRILTVMRSEEKLAAPIAISAAPEIITTEPARDIAFDARGTLAAIVTAAGTVEVRRLIPGSGSEVLHTFPCPAGARCALSPDGRWLAAGARGAGAKVIDLGARTEISLPESAGSGADWQPAFSPDSRWAAFSGRSLTVMRTGSWTAVPVPDKITNAAGGSGVVFLNTRAGLWLAAVGNDEDVHILHCGSELEAVATLRSPHPSPIGALAVSRTGVLACALPRGEICEWNLSLLRDRLTKLGACWDQPGGK